MIGTRVGPYEIIDEIGKGGMATVFRAYQPSVDRFVAIKIIHLAISIDRSSMERFQREAKLVARLEHPHLLPVYDYDGAHNPPYIVMRYLEGGTLKDVITIKGALPIPDIVHITQQLASALDYAHRQGVIHRDIKPTNIMIDQDGNAFLMDFGIARMTARSGAGEGLTQTGFAVGTPSYMSPEQGMGAADISPQADIYSLGVVVYQMATGELPYSAETPMAIVLRHINDPVPSARSVKPSLPIELDQAITKAMSKKASDRYTTATEFAEDLARAIAQVGVGRRPDVLRNAAQENVSQLRQRRQANQQLIDATMAQFESARVKSAQAAAAAKQRTPTPTPNTPAPIPVAHGESDDLATIIYPTENQPAITGSETSLQTPRTPTGVAAPPATAPSLPTPAARNRTTLILIGSVILLAIIAAFVLMQTINEQNTQATATAVALAVNGTESAVALAANGTETAVGIALVEIQTQTAQAAIDVTSADQTPSATSSGLSANSTTDSGAGDTSGLSADETPELQISLTLVDVLIIETATPTDTQPTVTDTATNTIVPSNTPIPTPVTPIAIAERALVLRAGPSLGYARAGELAESDEAVIIGTTEDGGWYQVQLADGTTGWLSTSFVDEAGNLNLVPFVEAPTFTPTFTATPTLTFTPSDTPMPSDTPTPTETYTATFTNTPIPSDTPTSTLTPSNTPSPTLTFTPSDTPSPTSTSTPTRGFALTLRNVTVRSGPGSEYQEVGTLPADSEVQIIGKTADLRWLLVVMPNGRSVWLANSPLSVRTSGNITDPPVIQAPTITPTP